MARANRHEEKVLRVDNLGVFQIGITLKMADDVRLAFDNQDIKMNALSDSMLEGLPIFPGHEEREIHLISVSGKELGATDEFIGYDEIVRRAEECYLRQCSLTEALWFRLGYKRQPIHGSLLIAIPPILLSGRNHILVARHDTEGLWLNFHVCSRGDRFRNRVRFVFEVPALSGNSPTRLS